MELKQVLALRQSCRAYTEEQISQAELEYLLQAANAAPIGKGMYQNVKITVVQNRDLIERLDASGADFFNKPGMHPSYSAPTFVVVSGLAEGGEVSPSMYCNGACIVENMSLAATELGLGHVYIMGMLNGIRKDEALCKELGVPEGFVILSALSVGKCASPQQPRELTTEKIQTQIIR